MSGEGDPGVMPPAGSGSQWDDDPAAYEELILVDLLDRLLDKGVVVSGDITLSVAEVDLVYVGLRLLLSSAHTAERVGVALPGWGAIRRDALGDEATGASPQDSTGSSLDRDALGRDALDGDALDADALDSGALGSDLGFPHGGR